ncbi:MAG: hypothetical protein V3U09_06785 [Thermoplasmata archaeon]
MNSIWAPIVSIAFLVASIPTLGVVPVEYEDSAELNLMTVVPVSDGTSVTIYERTGDWFILTYTVATLSGAGGKFDSAANEHYTFTTDGTYLISDCYKPYSTGGGHNIVAARLNGVPEYPDGIWIGEVVSYILGRDGIPESRFNALGEHMENHTRFGDENSQLVFAFLVESAPTEIEAEVECGPQTLNLGSMGKWITCYIELPVPYDPRDIDASTILMNGVLSPELDPRYGFVSSEDSYIVDHDEDGIPERLVKFDRDSVQGIAIISRQWEITLTGSLTDGTDFVGHEVIRTIHPQAKHMGGAECTERPSYGNYNQAQSYY